MTKLEQARKEKIEQLNCEQNSNNCFVNISIQDIDKQIFAENGWKLEPEKQQELKALEKFHWMAIDVVRKYYRGMITNSELMQHLMKKAASSKYSKTLCSYLADCIEANMVEHKMIAIASDYYELIIAA